MVSLIQTAKEARRNENRTMVDAISAAESIASIHQEYDNAMLPKKVIEHPETETSESTEKPETKGGRSAVLARMSFEDSTTNTSSSNKAEHCSQEREEVSATNGPGGSTKIHSTVPIPASTEPDDENISGSPPLTDVFHHTKKSFEEETVKRYILARTVGSRFFRENPPQELPAFDTNGKV
jgi:hypothetical protein